MSHRLTSNMNNPNVGLLNYDVYNARMKRGKLPMTTNQPPQKIPPKNIRETASSKSKLTMHTSNQPMSRSKVNTNQPVRDRNILPQSQQSSNNMIRKDLYPNNGAMVEVTVKTQKNSANSQNKPMGQPVTHRNGTGETWSKVLKNQPNSDDLRPFHSFDPLRTIHFLSKELQLRLIQKMPSDYNILEMLEDMQHALERVPPDLLSVLRMQIEDKESSNSRSAMTSESEYIRPDTSEKCIQTSKSFTLIASEKLHKHIEESSVKIEAACTQMEAVCTKLKAEKLELETLLRKERDSVAKLREQLTTQDVVSRAKEEELLRLVEELNDEKKTLEVDVKKLNAQLDNQQTMANEDLKLLIHELRKKKSDAEREAMHSKHKLTLTTMENEKITAQLTTRDRQINEMHDEMKQLQEVVGEQLAELQNIRCSTERSSVSTITESNVWHQPARDQINEKKDETDVITNIHERNNMVELVPKQSSSTCKAMISGDSSVTSAGLINVDYDGINMYLNKDFDEITGDAQQYKNAAAKLQTDYMLDSTTTTTAAYDFSLNEPINISNLIKNVKKQALSIAAPMQEKHD